VRFASEMTRFIVHPPPFLPILPQVPRHTFPLRWGCGAILSAPEQASRPFLDVPPPSRIPVSGWAFALPASFCKCRVWPLFACHKKNCLSRPILHRRIAHCLMHGRDCVANLIPPGCPPFFARSAAAALGWYTRLVPLARSLFLFMNS